MTQKSMVKIICICLCVLPLNGVMAQGLLGKRHASLSATLTRPGDDTLRAIEDPFLSIVGGLNIPANDNVDITVAAGRGELEGTFQGAKFESTSTSFLVGLNYHSQPGEETNPFFGIAVGAAETETVGSVPGKSAKSESTDFAATIAGGAETTISPTAAIGPNLQLVVVDDQEDFVASLPLNVWFNDCVYGLLFAGYAFDEGDILYGAGLGFGF